MLPHLLQVLQTLVLSPHDGGHPPQRCSLQLLAPVQRVSKLEEPHIVLGDIVNQVPGSVDLTKGKFVVILKMILKIFLHIRELHQFTLSYRTFIRSA